MLSNYRPGKRVRAADLFTKFTGGWGHEEFTARNHRLVKLKLGTVSADYSEGDATYRSLASDLGLDSLYQVKLRDKHEQTLVVPVIGFDIDDRIQPRLRKIHKALSVMIKNNGRKVLRGGNISWNVEHFTTMHQRNKLLFKWIIENLGTRKEPVLIPLLWKINQRDAGNYSIDEQTKVVDGMFEARCELTKATITKLKCNGI